MREPETEKDGIFCDVLLLLLLLSHLHPSVSLSRCVGTGVIIVGVGMLQGTGRRLFSTFALNPETTVAPHGPPRGLINRYVSMGLPPWAAWCNKINRHSLYRMSGVAPRTLLPKAPHEMDVIWLNERVRERVRTSRGVQNVYRQLKYPYVKTGIHYSDVLCHWVQVPMVEAAMFEVERDGGFDNFVLKRSGPELRSTYGERVRRHILVRQKEIRKNFVLDQQAKHLADAICGEVLSLRDESAAEAVLAKYGIEKKRFLEELARIVVARKEKANAVAVTAEEPLP
ncbi:39S ribosomal protein L28 [Trypanosoma cruzi]|uniref:39S ribosomal protein L28 n=2 Tax=Trypanosoma cruzi TaxID=5693 RepID=V5B7A9_TRYCR|nr:hypothetical protein TCDM_02154 [Trypanosoma cruzi Dm28c]RNF24233.1 39S ribosomal protein L28 [Trypanosoma cruzi]